MKINAPLNELNWFRTGGPAEYLAEPGTPEELREALLFAREKGLPVTVLGEGANVLVSDAGIPGLVLRIANRELDLKESGDGLRLRAGAGVPVQEAIDYALERRALGLEEFSGLPGTVGGAAFINAHFFEFFLADFLVAARVSDLEGGMQEVDRDWFQYGYDVSRLHREPWIVWSADFALKGGSELEAAFAKGRGFEIRRQRERRYPKERTCGSFFRNFLPEEAPRGAEDKAVLNVAYYLDKIGVKGALAAGGAKVSHKHANMLCTAPGATSADVVALARRMQELVYENFGAVPMPECRFLGFDRFPLHTAEDFR